MTRAAGFTFNKIKPEYYSDFVDSFALNPDTGFLQTVSNEQSIIQSIKNLVLTNMFERPYQPLLGSKVQSLNFEMNDPVTFNLLEQSIKETIDNFEPRAKQVSVQVIESQDSNAITITIVFSMRNINKPISFNILLPRVR